MKYYTRTIHCDLLILSLNCPEHLNVTTLLASSIRSSPVAGFLPSPLSFLLDAELPESADQDILAGGKFGLYQLKQNFDDFDRLVLRESVRFCYGIG